MSKRHLKQRLDELFSTTEEPEAVDADVAPVQADQSADQPSTPIGTEPAAGTAQNDREPMRALIDQLPLPAYIKDREHTWIAVNVAYGELIGHDPANLIGHTDKEQGDDAWQLDDRVLDTGQPAETQVATPQADGSIRTRRITRTALFNEQQQAQYVLAVVQDTVRAEEDLSKFKLGIDRANAAVTITDVQGTIVYVNPAYEIIYGYTRAEAIGQNPRILKSGHVTPEEYQRFWAKLLAGESVTGEIINKAKDGRLVTVETNNTPILDESGQITGFLSIQYDISERQQAEVDLRKFKLGLDRSNAAIFITDLNGTLTYVNPAFEKVYGFAPDEAIGRTPRILKSGVIPPEQYQRFWQTLLAGRAVVGEIINKTKDGRLVTIEGSNNPIQDESGHIIGFLAMHTDITERKATEAERERLLKSEARRAVQLQTVSEISNAISTVLDLDELLPFVVKLIQERFDLYYVGLFLLNGAGRQADLRAATGEAGRQLLDQRQHLPLDESSMIGWSILHRQARVALDVGDEAVRFNNQLLPNTRSEVALPLTSRGQVLGAVTAQSNVVAAFADQDVLILQTMADQVATAIANARLLEQARTASEQAEARLRETQFLQAVGQAVSSTLDLTTVIDVIFQTLEKDMGFTHAALAISDTAFKTITIVRASGTAIGLQGLARTVDQLKGDILLDILQKGKTEVIDGWDDRLDREIWEREGHAALVRAFVPLLLRGEPVGILEVGYWRTDRPQMTPEEVRLLDGTADQMAIAVGNARLFDDSQRRLTELAVVNEISRTLTATSDLGQLFVAIHQQVGRLFEASNFYIATYDGGDEWSLDYQYERNQLLPPARHKMGGGFTSYVLQSRQPLLIRSRQENTTFHQKHDLPQIGETATSWMGVPLMVAGNVTGAMGIQSYEQEWLYNEQNVSLFSTIGTQAAAAIQNVRLLQEARVRANELAALNDLSRTLASQLSVQQVLEKVWRGVSLLLDTTNFYIALYDAERQEVSFPINTSESTLDQEITVMPANQGLTGYLIRTKQPLLIKENVKATVSQLGLENVGADSQSYLGVPISIGDQVLGVVAIQSYTTARVYNEHDQNLLVAIAGQTAIALQNARLFEETRQRNAELAALNQIISSASETLDLRALLTMVLKQTLEVFEFDGGLVTLYNEARQKLERVVRTGLPGRIPDDPAEGLENSLCNYVFITQKELVIEDFRQGAPVDVSGEIQNGYFSYIGIPLESRGHMLGTWCGFRKQAGTFDKNTLPLLQTVGHQVSFAIENARLFAQTQTTLAETEQLYAASQRLTIATSLTEAVAAMAESVPVADINRAVLWSFERDKQNQVSAAIVAAGWYSGRGVPTLPTGTRLPATVIQAMSLVFTTEPLFSDDLKTDLRIDASTAALLQQQNIGAIAILPLWAAGRQIGALLLESEGTHTFVDAEIRPYTSLSQQLATTIYNQQLLDQTQRSSRQLTALNELGQAVSQQIEINQVLEATYQRLQQLVPVDAFMTVLYDQESNTISFPLVYDEGQHYSEPTGPLNLSSATGQVILTGNSILTLLTAQEFANIVEVTGAVGNVNKPSASLLYTPLKIGARTMGVLSIQSYQINAYDNDTVQLLSSVANQVAISIQNARLLEQSQRTAKREQTLRELTARVRSSSDPDTIVRTAVRELGLALGRPTFIRLGDAEQLIKPPASIPVSDNGSTSEAEGGQ